MVLLTRSNVISVVETMSLTKLYHDMAADIDMRNTNNLRLTYFCTKLMFRCTSFTTTFFRSSQYTQWVEYCKQPS